MRATTGARAIVARATGMRDTTRIAAQSRLTARRCGGIRN